MKSTSYRRYGAIALVVFAATMYVRWMIGADSERSVGSASSHPSYLRDGDAVVTDKGGQQQDSGAAICSPAGKGHTVEGGLPPTPPMSVLEAVRAGITAAIPSRQRDCCPVPGKQCGQRPLSHHQGAPRPCLIGPYDRDHAYISSRLRDVDGPGFALGRYADGERDVAKDENIGNSEWYVKKGEAPKMRQALRDSLRGHWGEDYFYGFPTMYDDAKGALWLMNRTEQVCGYVTYANIWVNSHYNATRDLLEDLTQRLYYGKTVLVVNEESINRLKAEGRDGFVADYVTLKDNDVSRWDDDAWQTAFVANLQAVARRYDGHLFIVSGGPIGKVIVGKMWDANCRNRYVDFGSSVDPIFRQRIARSYQQPGNPDAKRTDPVFLLTESGGMVEVNVK